MKVIHVFPDTNVFLHYPPLADIDWRKLCGADKVNLVICLAVIQELDAKKSDSRLADRASRAIKQIRQANKSAVEIRDGVTISIFNRELSPDDFASGPLSPESGDDRIVRLVRLFAEQNPNSEVAIATEDLGMELRCEAGNVPVIQMDASIRLENPQDEQAKKLRQATQELAALKNRLPKLRLTVRETGATGNSTEPPVFILDNQRKPLDVEQAMADVEARFPRRKPIQRKPSPPPPSPEELRRFASLMQEEVRIFPVRSMITDEQWKKYDKEVEEYIQKYRKHLTDLEQIEEIKSRCIAIELVLWNDGAGPATDIDVIVEWPESFLEAEIPPPEEPEAPKPFPELFNSNKYDVFGHPAFDSSIFESMGHDDPTVSVSRMNDGRWQTHVTLRKIKHGHPIVLGTLYACFAGFEDAKPFGAEYVISASELTNKVGGQLHLLVRLRSDSVGDAEAKTA
jgi:rRNA-processing protein FCF1